MEVILVVSRSMLKKVMDATMWVQDVLKDFLLVAQATYTQIDLASISPR